MAFAYGHTNGNTIVSNSTQATRFLDINSGCTPVCGRFVSYTGQSSGTNYSPGDEIDTSVDTEAIAFFTIEGNNTMYSDCTNCA